MRPCQRVDWWVVAKRMKSLLRGSDFIYLRSEGRVRVRWVHVRQVCEAGVGMCTERADVRETREGRRRRGGGRRKEFGLAGLPENGRVGEA